MAADEDDGEIGIPEWIVTFGDMMSLLLTFFIMLVSLSEIKEEEKFQALVESFRQQFGHNTAPLSMAPGETRPRNSKMSKLATQGRARRKNVMQGGNKIQSPTGDYNRVQIVRRGDRTSIGAVIHFENDGAELSEHNKTQLDALVVKLGGKPQSIEIRGHTTRRPVKTGQTGNDHWDLAFSRSRTTMKYLVNEKKIAPNRIRLSMAGQHEPVYLGTDPQQINRNARVEVFLLNQSVDSHQGTKKQRENRFTEGNS